MNKKKIWMIIGIIILIMLFMTLFINIYMINSTKKQIINLNDLDRITDVDAIVVLGCRVNGNIPSLMLSKRLDRGIDVYKKLKTKIILTGDHTKDNYDEVNVMRDYMLSSDVISSDIFEDHAGISTYDSIYRVKNIFRAKKIVIVTQKYHMYRAIYLANQLDIEAVGIVADDIPQNMIMFKNHIREVLSRDKNFFKGLFKPKSKYLGNIIPLNQDGMITSG